MRDRLGIAGRAAIFCATVASCVAPDSGGLATEAAGIIGGVPTPDGLYASTGALVAPSKVGSSYVAVCSGSLVGPGVVLTAAHCVTPQRPAGFTLARDARAVPASEVVVTGSAVPHPQYRERLMNGVGPSRAYDIAVVILATPITHVAPATLLAQSEGAMIAPETNIEMVGYGLTARTPTDPRAGIKHHGLGRIAAAGPWELLGYGEPITQGCFGDSGGPAFVRAADGGLRLGAVVSRGPADDGFCNRGELYTRVDVYRDWLAEVAGLPPDHSSQADGDANEPPGSAQPPDGADTVLPEDDPASAGGCAMAKSQAATGPLWMLLAVALLCRRPARGPLSSSFKLYPGARRDSPGSP
jgi:hypothetical protein